MNEDDLAHLIRSTFPEGTVLKKPHKDSMVKRWTSNQEMVYPIGNSPPKKVPMYSFIKAHNHLMVSKSFTREWFNENIDNASSRPCSFTTIGAVLVELTGAEYTRGKYYIG